MNQQPFNRGTAVLDEKSFAQVLETGKHPKGAKPRLSLNSIVSSSYVPVSFVAKDWGVSTRRVRYLLSAGRLQGRQQDNGVWEVVYPYSFIFGKRGPSLKRQQHPKRARNGPELKLV